MFLISQYLLNLSGTCKNINQISTYSIIIGLVFYASVYLYLLFYNNENITIFNKFIIYIITIDLLLSTFYYFNLKKSFKYEHNNFENIENYSKKIKNKNNDSDSDIESVDESLKEEESNIESDQEESEQEIEQQEDVEQDIEQQEDVEQDIEQQEDVEQDIEQQEVKQNLQEDVESDILDEIEQIDELLAIPVPVEIKKKRQYKKKTEINV
jgi:hypothetical protein